MSVDLAAAIETSRNTPNATVRARALQQLWSAAGSASHQAVLKSIHLLPWLHAGGGMF